ncbi:hypothetical protein KPL74_05260 [Bacillus sp. NP157]|nr:hypothetical protein KPL74_05260 [Bacillus sp. NP157]
MANEKNAPEKHTGQNDVPKDPRQPTRERETDSSGDAVDGSGEDNKRSKD